MSKKGDLHTAWQQAYRDAYPEITAADAQKEANEIWRIEKDNHKTVDALEVAINSRISECKTRALNRRSKYGLFFSKVSDIDYGTFQCLAIILLFEFLFAILRKINN